jgi:hypothetical protein
MICPSERKEPEKFESIEQSDKDSKPQTFKTIEELDKHYEEKHPEWRAKK